MQKQNSKIRVRFAPSPTGIPHIGNTRTALFNYLFARHNNGKFILRIEDTDRKRIVEGAEAAIFDSLKWLGINWDEELIYQSKRLELYKEYVQELLNKNIAHKKDGAVWVKLPEENTYEWTDGVGNKKITFKGETQEEFVILKSDGYPTYHLANVIDDHLMKISHVIRGEEWISSTPKHLYLYESFGWDKPIFVHLPVILGPDHAKLSKRHGAKSVMDYKGEGFLKESLLNFMALLGWNPGGDREQMSLEEMIKLFELKDVNTANPIFDVKKLEWLNGVWVRTLNEKKELKTRLDSFYKDNKKIVELLSSPKACDIVNAASSRMRKLTDFEELIDFKKQRKFTKSEKESAKKLLEYLNNKLDEKWDSQNLLLSIKEFSKENNISFKSIFFLLTGKEHGIGILELNDVYGKEFFINNLTNE